MKTPFHLREPEESDAHALIEAVRSSVAELQPWLPFATPDYGEEAALGWIRGQFGDRHRRLITTEDETVAGTVAINTVDDANARGNLGYWIRTSCAGRGLATEACRQLAAEALTGLGFQRLEILMAVENEASRRVAIKAGGHWEGIARRRLHLHGRFHDCHVFSMTPQDLAY